MEWEKEVKVDDTKRNSAGPVKTGLLPAARRPPPADGAAALPCQNDDEWAHQGPGLPIARGEGDEKVPPGSDLGARRGAPPYWPIGPIAPGFLMAMITRKGMVGILYV
ncbi:hypothetical protein CALCODRAFT_484855 [Calocera cornea HHB12733]|uniref:Uncharacterized protein n=1 Tax=Calocera cornea HHB12733 TaxID=1353952 RepID=A0A165EPU8_9BASI|nr:hypothetical protein CALCODRAFT_484855 [Calocera cornea HHB12733]